jgi:hypothetical protein
MLGGTGNRVVGVCSTGRNHSNFGNAPNIHMKAREITGTGAELVGFQMIDGFSDADLAAREARIEKLLQTLEDQIATRR